MHPPDDAARSEIDLRTGSTRGEGTSVSPPAEGEPPTEAIGGERESTLSEEVGTEDGFPPREGRGPNPEVAPGWFIGDYEILDELARGGMGVVFRARQAHLGRLVALKLVRDPSLATYDEIRRFRVEAEAVAQLDHPNIVPIYEIGQSGGQPYYSMKLIGGGSLSRHVSRLREDPRAAASLMAKVARAVHYAHQRAILHRDLKPSNILLGDDGEPYVTDFGLAKRIDHGLGTEQTVTGAVMGTPAYMPPEQAGGGAKTLTTSADIYSLGATLYELLTGRPPFTGDSAPAILRQVIDQEPARPRSLDPGLDRDLETICLKCLEKSVNRRYEAAGDLAEDLERWLEGRPIAARPATVRERATKWVRRHRTLAALIAVSTVSLFLIFVGGIFLTTRLLAALASLEDSLYIAEMNQALRAIESRLPVLAAELLDKQVPDSPLAIDRRGFEWHFLGRVCRPLELRGHKGIVRALAVDRSGQWLFSTGEDDSLRKWNLDSGKLISTQMHKGWAQAVAVSPDGRWVASGGFDKSVTIRDASTFRTDRVLGPYPGKIWEISFSPDSRRLAFTVEVEEQARVFDVNSGAEVDAIPLPPKSSDQNLRSRALRFGSQGRLIAMSGGSKIVLRGAEPGGLRQELAGHDRSVTGLAFSPDDSLLASSSEDGTIRIWETASGGLRSTLRGPAGNVNSVEFSPDGKRLACAIQGKQAILWDVATGREERSFPHALAVQAVAFRPDGKRLLTACNDGLIRVWDISDETSVALPGEQAALNGVAVRPDGLQIAAIGSDRSLSVWTLDRRFGSSQPAVQKLCFIPAATAYSPDGRYLAVAGTEGKIQVCNSSGLKLVAEITDPKRAQIQSVAFGPDGLSLAAVGADGYAKIWDWKTNRISKELRGLEGSVFSVAFSPDGRRVATGSWDGVRLWNPESGELEKRLPGFEGFAQGVAFSPDGRFLATAGDDHIIRLWDLTSWSTHFRELKGHSGSILGVAFSPLRGQMRIASAGTDRTVKLWDTRTGQQALTLEEHTREVKAVAFGPEGRFLVSASTDGTARLWIAAPRE
ncbi:MAG: protein kinase [Isosphaeraceae bacterium]